MRRATRGLFLVAVLAVGRAEAQSEPPSSAELLRQARSAVEELRYDDALATLGQISPDAPPLVRMQSLEVTAVVHLLEGRAAVAQPLLEELYFLAPAFVLDDPSLPPRVTKMFAEEAARPHKRALSPSLRPDGADLRAFELVAGGAAARVDLACRAATAGGFLPIESRFSDGRARFRLPSEGTFECHALVSDGDGLPLGRLGTTVAPVTVRSRKPPPPPAPPPPEPLTEDWRFWTGIGGGVLVIGAVVVAVAVATRPEEPPEADLTVELAPTVLRW